MPKLFLREEPCRHLIELLFFASVGDVTRMRELCQRHNVDVRTPGLHDEQGALHCASSP
jgi:hypothetical protein